MIGIWTDCRGHILDIIPNSWFFCLEWVAWIHFYSSSETCGSSWRSSNLFTLSCLGMIIFISTLPWSLISLSTSTSCHSGNTLLCKETIQCCSTTSGQILIPHYNATTLSLRRTLGDKINSAIWQKQQIRPNGLAESSTVLFQNFYDQYCNWSIIELPRNGAKGKCKLLKICQANVSTKTGRKGCAG